MSPQKLSRNSSKSELSCEAILLLLNSSLLIHKLLQMAVSRHFDVDIFITSSQHFFVFFYFCIPRVMTVSLVQDITAEQSRNILSILLCSEEWREVVWLVVREDDSAGWSGLHWHFTCSWLVQQPPADCLKWQISSSPCTHPPRAASNVISISLM